MSRDTLPFDQGAERSVLGALMLAPERLEEVDLQPGEFHAPHHRALFALLVAMAQQGQAIDLTTVPAAVAGDPDRYGGLAYVIEMPDATPATANVKHYARIVRQHAQRRAVVEGCLEAVRRAQALDSPGDVAATLRAALDGLYEGGAPDVVPDHVAGASVLDDLEERERTGRRLGLSTGLPPLDAVLGGLAPGDLVVLAARPGMGKTALAIQVADHVADLGTPVLFVSLEMRREQLAGRMLARRGDVHAWRMRDGKLGRTPSERDLTWGRLLSAQGYIERRRASVLIADRSDLTASALGATVRRAVRRKGVAMVVVDYLQLIRTTGPSRERSVAELTRALKCMASDLGVPVLALSQLNRENERAARKPQLSDLRESGAIEQDADSVLMLWREREGEELPSCGTLEVLVRKNRHGPCAVVPLWWDGPTMRITEQEAG